MISTKSLKRYCCEDIRNIENYEEAVADKTQLWECHHRLEIFMMWRISKHSLKESGLYYNQPANRLILLPHSEHLKLHKGFKKSKEAIRRIAEAKRGKKLSEEHRRNLSESLKGKKKSEATRRKMSEWQKGKKFSDETRLKISENRKGKGIGQKRSEETKRRMSEARKLYWKNKHGGKNNG